MKLNWIYRGMFLLLLFSKGLYAGEVFVDKPEAKLIGESLLYFDDQDNASYFSVLVQLDQFEKWNKPVFSKPAQPGKIWFYFSLKNSSNEDVWMDINNSNLTYIAIYKFDRNHALLDSAHMGSMVAKSGLQNGYTFQHKLVDRDDKREKHFLLGVQTNLNYEVPIFIGSYKNLSNNRNSYDYMSVFVLGAFLLLFLYNVFIFFVTRDKIYLHYSAYLMTALVAGSYLNNFPFIESFIGKTWAYYYVGTWLWLLFGATGLFTISYFDLKKVDPVFYKTILGFILVFAGFGVANLFVSVCYLANYYQFVAILFYTTCLVFSYRLLFRGVKRARLYCVGWSFMMLSAILYIFVYNGLLPYNALTRNIFYLGSLIEILIFSIALGRRITDLQFKQIKLNKSLSAKNDELLNLNDSLDSFNYHVSHDLKTVLNNAKALTLMVKKYVDKDDKIKLHEVVEKLNRVTDNGIETVQSFLSLGKLDSMLKKESREKLILKKEIARILDLHGLKNDLKVSIKRDQLKSVNMHCKAFESIYLNLFTNTIKYSESNPTAELEFLIQGKNIIFVYQDFGNGIDMEKYGDSIFKPFVRGGDGLTAEGTGIGLYILSRIVKKYDGSVDLQSQLGKGIRLTMKFPKKENH